MMEQWLYWKGMQKIAHEGKDNIFYGPTAKVSIDDDDSIGQLLFDTLKNLPQDNVFLIDGETDETWTVGQFLQKSVNLSVGLTGVGVDRGDHIVIIAENTVAASVVAFATWFVGAVMCPIDPALKTYEFQHLFRIMNPKIVFCEHSITEEVQDALRKVDQGDCPIFTFQEAENETVPSMEKLVTDASIEEFSVTAIDDLRNELAAVMCSSGSTGLPKGVGLSNYSLAYHVKLSSREWKGVSIIQPSYFYWVSGLLVLIFATIGGSSRILLRTVDPVKILHAIDKYKPNFSVFSPSLFMTCWNHTHIEAFDISSLKTVMVGGSPVSQVLIDKAKEITPNVKIIQGYGATELCGLVSSTANGSDLLSVGVVTVNCALKICDPTTGKALPLGEEGEIVCKSPSRMLGYVSNEKATREVIDDDGWYRTGDVGKVTAGGVIYVTGRMKELLKVDNHQVAPAEIEGVITQVAGVLEAVVCGIPKGENSLPLALVVKKPGSTVTTQDIISAVKENLSEFKQLQAGVFFVEFLPRTSTGKLKRNVIQLIAENLYNGND